MTNELYNYIKGCLDLSEQELHEVVALFDRKSFPRKTVLLKKGDVCTIEGFIVNGCVKTYFIDSNGFEVILTFATENWWVSDLVSFHDQTPGNMFIETLEDSELLVLSPETKKELLARHPGLEKMFRLIVQRHLASYQERLFGNIALTADERYDEFLKKHPALPQRIPQHLIASYLGISAEFLSRLRSRKLKH